ncbi:MAG TPA: peptidoglycan bridge formation glycyltransferase FemA/FemB family protein [Anaerolineales bacterium]|nr:peptidoglycan bridge formation glycyltransferase FemA/FemB family protein [Anaerolineales bacterium]
MNAVTWNHLIRSLPSPHVLQTWEWGDFKSRYGWQPIHQRWGGGAGSREAAALILKRGLSRRLGKWLSVLYIPKGPLLDWHDQSTRATVFADLEQIARSQGAIFIKIDPDVIIARGIPGEPSYQPDPLGEEVVGHLRACGWHFSQDQVQFRNTMEMDLSRSEDELLVGMKQKTRYNIRLASRRGVEIRRGGLPDLPTLYQMYAETSVRDGFVIRSAMYYLDLWSSFIQAGLAEPLIAAVAGTPVAGLLLFHFDQRAWYLYGMSSDQEREKMPNYLLQWEAIRQAKALGCRNYDLWGAPDEFSEQDSMWGVYRFKDGLGAQVVQHIGAWDLPVRPNLYMLYTRVLPQILDRMRQRGTRQTRQVVGL